MDEERDHRNREGVDTADQPAEGGPYIEDRASERQADIQRGTEEEPTDQSIDDQRRAEEHAPQRQTSSNTGSTEREELAALFDQDATEKFRARWLSIQSKFVDDPSDSVKQADQLVDDVIQGITLSFADRRGTLEKQWNGGAEPSTEDLRIALKQYRSFFDRLLAL